MARGISVKYNEKDKMYDLFLNGEWRDSFSTKEQAQKWIDLFKSRLEQRKKGGNMAKRKLKRSAKIKRSYCAKKATSRRKRAKKSLLDKILSF